MHSHPLLRYSLLVLYLILGPSFVWSSVYGQPVVGQGPGDGPVAFKRSYTTEYNLLSRRIAYLRMLTEPTADDLLLTEEQKLQLKDLYQQYQEKVIEPARANPGAFMKMSNAEKEEFLQSNTNIVRGISDRAMNEILLPHQTTIVLRKEFSDTMLAFDGNVLAVIAKTGSLTLGITPEQEKKILEKGIELNKKIEEAKRKFQEELDEIRKIAEQEIAGILTPEQTERLRILKEPEKK